ncbi:ABC transporter substrate-binding protein, partial [Mesorhizobium sp. M2E.F.Ca.ET.154.01.1.1]
MTKRLCIYGLAVAGLLASVAVPASAADTITVASWGGTYQDAETKAFFDPTAKELG